MNPTRLMTQTATVAHVSTSGAPDPYGNPIVVITTETVACYLSMVTGTEVEGGVVQVVQPTLYLPPDTTLDGGDHVTIDGTTYEVDGPPANHFDPRDRRYTHVQALLKRAG